MLRQAGKYNSGPCSPTIQRRHADVGEGITMTSLLIASSAPVLTAARHAPSPGAWVLIAVLPICVGVGIFWIGTDKAEPGDKGVLFGRKRKP